MHLRLLGFVLGAVAGFDLAWARLTDPDVFHRMFALRSAMVYLLMGSAVAVAVVGSLLLRRHRAPLTAEVIDWQPARPTRSHIGGSVAFGLGWALSNSCPGPTAAQLGAGRVLAVAIAAGIAAGVALQPVLARRLERARRPDLLPTSTATEVL